MKFIILLIISLSTVLFGEDKLDIKTYTNIFGMEFVYIKAGKYMMGSKEKSALPSEKPAHEVVIKNDFYIGKYEVTQEDWEKIMGYNPYKNERSNPYYKLEGMAERITKPKNPATVSWNDAKDFIKKLNERDVNFKYRLPTEEEWEYVARAGTDTIYFFGNDIKDLHLYAWYGEDFESGGTHTVGLKKPNRWGLYDIYGNVWEWTENIYKNYSDKNFADNKRAVRGGSWHSSAGGWHSSYRKAYPPDYRGISIGFRLIMENK